MQIMKITVKKALDWVHQQFDQADLYYGHGTDNAWDEAVQLVLTVAELPLDSGDEVLPIELDASAWQKIQEITAERIDRRIPMPYLLKQAWFAGLPFYVDERVIIPRSPFAEWINRQFSPWIAAENVTRILDLCTGSGCMAIAAAHAFENATVDAVDISKDALAVAKINVDYHDLNDRVKLIQSDGFNNIPEQQYDIIMSNPPYVSDEEMQTLPQEYHHEPDIALRASNQGLTVVDHILQNAARFLHENGILIVEVGNTEEAVNKAYPNLEFTWLEQQFGGHGLFLLTKQQLTHVRK